VGGFTLLRAVRRSEFAANGANSRVDHTVMLTYRQGVRSTADVRSTTEGNFQITVNNHSTQFALQLRENHAQGTVLAFLNAGELHRVINFSDTAMRTLFPVWVAYNTRTRSIVTSAPTGHPFEAQSLIPVAPADQFQPILSFPYPGAASGEFAVDLPFATVRVQNNTGILLQLRNAQAQIRTTSGLQGVNMGTWDVFEINPPTAGGLNLNLANGAGTLSWDVRFLYENTPPVLERGFEYLIVLNSTVAGTTATLTRVAAIDTSDFLLTN